MGLRDMAAGRGCLPKKGEAPKSNLRSDIASRIDTRRPGAGATLEAGHQTPGFESLNNLCLSLYICKMGIIIVSAFDD